MDERASEEQEIKSKDINHLFKKLKYHSSTFGFKLNSFLMSFCSEDDETLYFFWADPPWRIALNNKIITNSESDYPSPWKYTEDQQEQEEQDRVKWAAKTMFMRKEKVKNIIIKHNYDLEIEWENGAVFNCFANSSEDVSYNFFDEVNLKVYGIQYGEILRKNLEKRETKGNG